QWKLETTLHYTKGKGFYENYKQGAAYSKYNLPDQVAGAYSDFIRKKWLDNDFYGGVSTLYAKLDNLDLNFGLVANHYFGKHFGQVSAVYVPAISSHEYSRNSGVNDELAGFAKAIYRLTKLDMFGDLQLRNTSYDTSVTVEG